LRVVFSKYKNQVFAWFLVMSGTEELHFYFQHHLLPPSGKQKLKCLYFANCLSG